MGNSLTSSSNNPSETLNLFNNDGSLCDAECRKKQQLVILEQNYQNAKSNLANAPSEYEIAKKKYYASLGNNSSIEQMDYSNKADKIGITLQNNFNKSYKEASILLQSYEGVYINLNNVFDLLQNYIKENNNLENKIKKISSDIVTNDRKTFYEDQSIEVLKKYYKWMKYVYIFILIVYIFCIFLIPQQMSRIKELLILFFLILYPFIVIPVWKFILKIYNKIKEIVPKNVYKSLGPL
jgi:hypothetical protein